MTPQLHENILHHVLRAVAVADDTDRSAVHDGTETVEDLRERVIIPSR